MVNNITVFHVTNHKAGSQWIAEILKHCAPSRFTVPANKVMHMLRKPTKVGSVMPAIYLPKADFERALLGKHARQSEGYYPDSHKYVWTHAINWYHFWLLQYPYKVVVVIRDLRDILVSQYFSLLTSHPLISDEFAARREKLTTMDKETGMLYLLKERLLLQAQIQKSWLPAECNEHVKLIKFEDLLSDEHSVFENIVNYCEIDVDHQRLHDIVQYNSFQVKTGRERGREDVSSHLRKGIAGDWKNYFTERLKVLFKEKFGQLLIETGYEKDLNW